MSNPEFVLPDTFRLGARQWTVKKVNRKAKWWGRSEPVSCLVEINMRHIRHNDDLEHTFYHELVHAMCATLGWSDIHGDELKVDALANMLMQFRRNVSWVD